MKFTHYIAAAAIVYAAWQRYNKVTVAYEYSMVDMAAAIGAGYLVSRMG